jgi:spore coat polysaccharide biosynthesis protein SpsF
MSTVAVIQARLGSKRLPKKVLAEIAGKPLLAHVLERAQAIQQVDDVVINVPLKDREEILEVLPRGTNVLGIPDQEKDVLGSYKVLADVMGAKVIVRLTGDCPLLDPAVCDHVIHLFNKLQEPLVYCANDTLRSGLPDGTDVEVTSAEAITLAYQQAREPFDREHVMPWIRKTMPNYTIAARWGQGLKRDILHGWLMMDTERHKWSVDTKEDLSKVQAIMQQLKPGEYSWEYTWEIAEAVRYR